MPEKYSSIKEGKSRPMPEAMDRKHSKEILEADTPEQKEALEDAENDLDAQLANSQFQTEKTTGIYLVVRSEGMSLLELPAI